MNADLACELPDIAPADHAHRELRARLCSALKDQGRADEAMRVVGPFLSCQREALAAAHRNTASMPPLPHRIRSAVEHEIGKLMDALIHGDQAAPNDWASTITQTVWSEVHPTVDRLWARITEQQELIDRLIRERDSHESSGCGATHPDYGPCVEHSPHESAHWYTREPRRNP